MKRLKITSVLLSVSMCFSMLMTPVCVIADETADTTETAETPATTEAKPSEPSDKKAPKETEAPEETTAAKVTEAPKESEPSKETEESKETEAPKETETETTEETEATEETATPKSGPEQTDKKTKKGAAVHSGSFKDINWTLDSYGVLTVSGGECATLTDGNYPWLEYKSDIKKVVLEKPVVEIGYEAFKNCTNLTEVVFNDDIYFIGESAFYGCEKLTKIKIPSGLYQLYGNTFENCKNLKEVSFLGGLQKIFGADFAGCESLESITIPNSVTVIGYNTFKGCKNLKEVNLPDNLITLGSNVFESCTSLESIKLPDTLKNLDYCIFKNCTNSNAFKNCRKIKSITIPDKVTKLDAGIFQGCENLESVVLPDGLTTIGSEAFANCKSLKSIDIPDSVNYFASSVFYGCESLESIAFPKSATSVSDGLFKGCTSLKTVTFSGPVTVIDASAFENTNLSSFEIPDGVTKIYGAAFKGCKNLTSVSIPKSVTNITKNAFKDCTSLAVVNYAGSEEAWNNITIDSSNSALLEATINFAENSAESFAIKVNSGTSDCSSATLNKTVTITADAAPEGKVFFKCEVVKGNISLKNEYSSVTTFQMPDEDVEITAIYKTLHTVTVNSGTAEITSAIEGQRINIKADAAPEGKKFFSWEAVKGNVKFYVASYAETFFYMPDEDVEIKATYKALHTITVVSGTADKTSELSGYSVRITADAAPEGKVFDKWVVVKGNVELSNPTSSVANVIMPDEDVEIKATYKDIFVASGSCGADITWTLDYSGSLKITGSGPMYNDRAFGWESYKKDIRIIDIDEGVTSIGNSAFAGIDSLIIYLPQTITSIGDGAFKDCRHFYDIDFNGSSEDFAKVVIGENNEPLINSPVYCQKDGVMVYSVIVISGTAGKPRVAFGDTVAITADAAPDGKVFDKWLIIEGKIKIADLNASSTTFEVMSSGIIKLQATYKDLPTFDVSLTKEGNGTVEATPDKAKAGTQINIKATPDEGYRFKEWQVTEGGVTLDDQNSATTTFTIGSSNVTVKAVFEEIGPAPIGTTFEVSGLMYTVTGISANGTASVRFEGLGANAGTVTTLSIPATVEDKSVTYNVTSIGANALKDNADIKTVIIGSKVVSIGNNAFYGCKNLAKVSGRAGLKTIGTNAFARCPKLWSFVISSKVLWKIGPQAFYKDSKLKTVSVRNTTKLTKSGVKKSLKGSSVKTVRVKKSKVKKFKKYFTKKNCGRKVKVKK